MKKFCGFSLLVIALLIAAISSAQPTNALPGPNDSIPVTFEGEIVYSSLTIPPGVLQVKGIVTTAQTYPNGAAPVCQKSDQFGATYADIADQSWSTNSIAVSVGLTAVQPQAVVVDFTCTVGNMPANPSPATVLQYIYPLKGK